MEEPGENARLNRITVTGLAIEGGGSTCAGKFACLTRDGKSDTLANKNYSYLARLRGHGAPSGARGICLDNRVTNE